MRAAHGTLLLFAGLMGCGGGSAAATTPASRADAPADPKSEVATGNTLTAFQKARLLGHYSTRDGASGFILDRTVVPWKAKLDGVTLVVVLNLSNEPRRGVKEYTSADHSVWVRVGEEGDVQLFQGPKQHEGVEVHRDADAEQLK